MTEMMFDLETLDILPSAIILSVGAVVFKKDGTVIDKFYRKLAIIRQLRLGRTISSDTHKWWLEQSEDALDEAFSMGRQSVGEAVADLNSFVEKNEVSAFYAGPATFDFPIWDSMCFDFNLESPWRYNNKYDHRTVIRESGLRVADMSFEISGKPHMPVYDCEWQIAALTEARNKLKNNS